MFVSQKLSGLCHKVAWSVIMLVLFTGSVLAQNIAIKGKVVDKNGEPVIGVTVMVEGTKIGISTDLNGDYTINAPANGILVFSAIGMETKKEPINNRSVVNITMNDSSIMLEELVVTAMGIKKERKALGYAVQDVKSEELMKSKTSNILNSLTGKIAGVNITQAGGSAGAGAQIIIRGGTSLERDNQPLFVVDGVIYDNSTSAGGNSGFDGMTRTASTSGNRIMDINPEDIENVSVLKGLAASALYGSRAAAGAIMITTKKGKAGDMKINFNSKFTASWANRLPEQQDMYKRGRYNNAGTFTDFTTESWGDKFGSNDVMYNNIADFFQTSTIYDNNISVSGGNERGTFFLSAGRFDQKGIVPETGFDKTTFRFNGEQKRGKLTVGANVAYSVANTQKTLTSSGLWDAGGNGAMQSVYTWARSEDMSKYLKEDGTKYRMFEGLQPLANDLENPYWIINKNNLKDKTNRLTASVYFNAEVTKWFDISYKYGIDTYTRKDRTLLAPNGAVREMYQNGRLSEVDNTYEYLSSNLMMTFKHKIADFDFNLLLGNAIESTRFKNDSRTGFNFIVPNFFSFENIKDDSKKFSSTSSLKRIAGLFGEFRVAYKNYAYLTASIRNDWSSSLVSSTLANKGNYSYSYPAVSGSFIFSEILHKNQIVSFGKVRFSLAKVGKDTNPYATGTTLWAPKVFLGGTGVGNSWTRGNPYLKPEMSESIEAGLEMKFFNGRVGFDYTFYTNDSYDQIVSPRLSQTTGYILLSTNVGNVKNKGMELAITALPVQTKDFTWDIIVNMSGNRGTVEKLLTGQDVLYVTDVQVGNAKAASFNNGIFMGLSGSKWKRDENGEVILDWNTGMPTSDNLATYNVGNREPKLYGGLVNNFRYKNWTASIQLDYRIGGDIFNGTDYAMTVAGMSKRSMDRESITISGVSKNPVTGLNEPKSVTYQSGQFYNVSGGVQRYGNDIIREYYNTYLPLETSNFITNTNWLRLSSINVSYTIPESLLKRVKFIRSATVNFTGTNLLLLTNYKGLDPETTAAGSGVVGSSSVGIDYCGVPATRGFSFGLNLSF